MVDWEQEAIKLIQTHTHSLDKLSPSGWTVVDGDKPGCIVIGKSLGTEEQLLEAGFLEYKTGPKRNGYILAAPLKEALRKILGPQVLKGVTGPFGDDWIVVNSTVIDPNTQQEVGLFTIEMHGTKATLAAMNKLLHTYNCPPVKEVDVAENTGQKASVKVRNIKCYNEAGKIEDKGIIICGEGIDRYKEAREIWQKLVRAGHSSASIVASANLDPDSTLYQISQPADVRNIPFFSESGQLREKLLRPKYMVFSVIGNRDDFEVRGCPLGDSDVTFELQDLRSKKQAKCPEKGFSRN